MVNISYNCLKSSPNTSILAWGYRGFGQCPYFGWLFTQRVIPNWRTDRTNPTPLPMATYRVCCANNLINFIIQIAFSRFYVCVQNGLRGNIPQQRTFWGRWKWCSSSVMLPGRPLAYPPWPFPSNRRPTTYNKQTNKHWSRSQAKV